MNKNNFTPYDIDIHSQEAFDSCFRPFSPVDITLIAIYHGGLSMNNEQIDFCLRHKNPDVISFMCRRKDIKFTDKQIKYGLALSDDISRLAITENLIKNHKYPFTESQIECGLSDKSGFIVSALIRHPHRLTDNQITLAITKNYKSPSFIDDIISFRINQLTLKHLNLITDAYPDIASYFPQIIKAKERLTLLDSIDGSSIGRKDTKTL